MYAEVLERLEKTEKKRETQKIVFTNERKQYKEEIKKLKGCIDEDKINLGHIYSYK